LAAPIFPFDIRAFVNEPSLKPCSAEARLLWLYMLFFMHTNSKAYGYLPDHATREKVCEKACISASKYPRLLKELEEHKVFSTTQAGTIYCRRMVREASRGNSDRQTLQKVLEDLLDQYPPERVTLRSSIRAEFWRLVEDGVITLANSGEILAGLDRWKISAEWHAEKGKYIPGLLKWLSDERWKSHPRPHAMSAPPRKGNGRDPMALFIPEWS
jgi:hypothetical protein